MKQSVSSSGFPPTVTTFLLFVLAFIILVLFILMLRPVLSALTLGLADLFSLASVHDWVIEGPGHRQNPIVQLAPKGPLDSNSCFFVVVFIIQSMATRNMNGDRRHPCLTQDCLYLERLSKSARMSNLTCHPIICDAYQCYNFLRYTVVSMKLLKCVSVKAIECLLRVDKVHV